VCILHYPSAHEAAGALGIRHSRAPSFEAEGFAQLGRNSRRGIAKLYFAVIASAAKQSITQQKRKLDCFAALAMTI
jgi:hypothetical protein